MTYHIRPQSNDWTTPTRLSFRSEMGVDLRVWLTDETTSSTLSTSGETAHNAPSMDSCEAIAHHFVMTSAVVSPDRSTHQLDVHGMLAITKPILEDINAVGTGVSRCRREDTEAAS